MGCRRAANLFIFVLAIFDPSHEYGRLVREYQAFAVFPQIPVSRPEYSIEHTLIQ